MSLCIWVNIGSGNSLLPFSATPLPEKNADYCQLDSREQTLAGPDLSVPAGIGNQNQHCFR